MYRLMIIMLFITTFVACSVKEELSASKKRGLSKIDIVNIWKGKHAQELVLKYGQPDLVIDTTLLGRAASEGMVYETSRLAGNPECMNVYVIGSMDKKITDYFCR